MYTETKTTTSSSSEERIISTSRERIDTNLVRMPNKPLLSIDASARANNTVKLSPGYVEVASGSSHDDYTRRIMEVTQQYSAFGSKFFEMLQNPLNAADPANDHVRYTSSMRQLRKTDSTDDSGRATTSSETSSLCEFDEPGAFSVYRRPSVQPNLGDLSSSSGIFDSAMDFGSMQRHFEEARNDFFNRASSIASLPHFTGFQTPTTSLGSALQELTMHGAFSPIRSSMRDDHPMRNSSFGINELLQDSMRHSASMSNLATPQTTSSTTNPKVHRVPIKIVHQRSEELPTTSSFSNLPPQSTFSQPSPALSQQTSSSFTSFQQVKPSFGPLQVDVTPSGSRTGLGALANIPGLSSAATTVDDTRMDTGSSPMGRTSDLPSSISSSSSFLYQPFPTDELERTLQQLTAASCLSVQPNRDGVVDPNLVRSQLEAVKRQMRLVEDLIAEAEGEREKEERRRRLIIDDDDEMEEVLTVTMAPYSNLPFRIFHPDLVRPVPHPKFHPPVADLHLVLDYRHDRVLMSALILVVVRSTRRVVISKHTTVLTLARSLTAVHGPIATGDLLGQMNLLVISVNTLETNLTNVLIASVVSLALIISHYISNVIETTKQEPESVHPLIS